MLPIKLNCGDIATSENFSWQFFVGGTLVSIDPYDWIAIVSIWKPHALSLLGDLEQHHTGPSRRAQATARTYQQMHFRLLSTICAPHRSLLARNQQLRHGMGGMIGQHC